MSSYAAWVAFCFVGAACQVRVRATTDMSTTTGREPPLVPLSTKPHYSRGNRIDITTPIDLSPPLAIFAHREHEYKPVGVDPRHNGPVQTNKWFGAAFVEDRTMPLYAMPYTYFYSDTDKLRGLGIGWTNESRRVFGGGSDKAPQYFFNPPYEISVGVTAQEFEKHGMTATTRNVNNSFGFTFDLQASGGQGSYSIPLASGLAWTTFIATNLTPVIQFSGAILSLTQHGANKYVVSLNDGSVWLVYVFDQNGVPAQGVQFVQCQNQMVAAQKFSGLLQIANLPQPADEDVYDAFAGTYVAQMNLYGSVSGNTGEYGFRFSLGGNKKNLPLHFAFPHHVSSFSEATSNQATSIKLCSTVRGVLTAYAAKEWIMQETNLPTNIHFTPHFPISDYAQQHIRAAAVKDIAQEYNTDDEGSGFYFNGKVIAKLAQLCLVAHDVLGDQDMANSCMEKVETALNTWVQNRQQGWPLIYDTSWKGVISSGAFATGNWLTDFGNSYYNDHNFHFGYFIYAAAVAAHINPNTIQSNRDWVNTLIRDAANPTTEDPYFPQSRSFDWFAGHSWAQGIKCGVDGKDIESTSEDINYIYACKLWGEATGDQATAARANLQLAILNRSTNLYMLYMPGNGVIPEKLIPNFVSGIFFMNKIDHATCEMVHCWLKIFANVI